MNREPRAMRGWTIEATCPRCAGPLLHVADGRPSITEARAVARCSDCGSEWLATLTLRPALEVVPRYRQPADPDRTDLVHGSRHGYNRGCRCHECRNAESVYRKEWRRTRQVS